MKENLTQESSKKLVRVAVALILRDAKHNANKLSTDGTDREILITKRPSSTVYPGWWEFPGGKVEQDEAPEAAAAREIYEELGVRILGLIPLNEVHHVYEHAAVHLHAFTCRLAENSPEPQNLEVEAHQWIPVGDLPYEPFLPGNTEIVEALQSLTG
ncbi:MAG: NUDIX domain-containing protein [Planctomycetota bacterium]